MLVKTPEVYGNFSGSDVNGFSVAAKVLAKKVPGVTINPNPPIKTPEGWPRKILAGSFDLLVDPEARPLVDLVMGSAEVKLFYDVGSYPYPGPHNISSFCEDEKEPIFSLIPDAAKRIEVAKLNRIAVMEQLEADLSFKRNPVEAVRHDVRAISAKRQAKWLSEELLPVEDIVTQVIDRKRALLAAVKKLPK